MQGAIFSGTDIRDYKAVYTASGESFPKEFELKTIRIKDQQAVGSCVAHALSSIIEYYNYTQNNDDTEMSTGYIYGNRSTSKHKGAGMVMRDALEAVMQYGDVPRANFPYNIEVPYAIKLFEMGVVSLFGDGYPHRISQYYRVDSENAIKATLKSENPVLIAMEWYSDMEVVDGVLTTSHIGYDGGHCMFIYGWDERGWKVQNSWGESWGVNGTMIVPYDMKIEECWAMTDDIIEGVIIKKPFTGKIGKTFAKLVNSVCNIVKKHK